METATKEGSLRRYQETVVRVPRVDGETVRELSWRAYLGDREARRVLIERHLYIVMDTAEYLRPGTTEVPESWVRAGNLALVEAVESYRPWADGDFERYVVGEVLAAVSEEAIPGA